MKIWIPVLSMIFWLVACGSFNENMDNVIADKKIRPFAIRVTPAEAMPGDTVIAELFIWDAGQAYTVDWSLGLGYSIGNYGQGESVEKMLDLDSMALEVGPGALKIKFVVPTGENNPITHSPMLPEQLNIPGNENGGLYARSEIVHMLDSLTTFPNSWGVAIEAFGTPLYIQAQVISGDFKLEVMKNLTVRYAKKLESGERISSVNENPRMDSLGWITVHEKGVVNPANIAGLSSDTVWYPLEHDAIFAQLQVNSLAVSRENSYFVLIQSDSAQRYLSPNQIEHSELLQYQWFFTNLMPEGDEWSKQLQLEFFDGNSSAPLAHVILPQSDSEREFALHIVLRDNRPEWQMQNSAGIDFVQFHGQLEYQ